MKIEIPYQPTYKQFVYHTTDAEEVLYGGAAGGGKSHATVMDALMRTLKYPKTEAYIFRRTYPELEGTIIKTALMNYPNELGKYNTGKHEYHLKNGSIIRFRHCASKNDMHLYQGAEIQFLYFDELTLFEQEIYDFIRTRLRANKALGVVPITRSTSNPGGIGHGWVKARFVDAGPYMQKIRHKVFSEAIGKEKIITSQYIPSLATENPHLTSDYIFELERKPEALRKALLYGHWDAFEGQVFVEWVDDPKHYMDRLHTHVIEPFPIPDYWPRYMSFDFGYAKPFSCGWWAISPDGTAYRYKEMYGCEPGKPNTGIKITPREIAERIVDFEREEAMNNIRVTRVCDPSIFDLSRGNSIAEQMGPTNYMTGGQCKGVIFEGGDNNRLAGLAQMHERLRFDKSGRPKLQVFKNCRDFIRTIPNLPYSTRDTEDVDTDSEDHIFDETKYFLMMNPLPVQAPRRTKPKLFNPYDE